MSTTYVAVIVNVLTFLLPKLGISVGSEELTTTLQVLFSIGTGLWILKERYNRGDINIFGAKL